MGFSPSDIPHTDAVDVSDYPEDTRDAISAFSELWRIEPPHGRKGPKSFWIQAARDLNEACGGESKVRQVLRALFADWNALLHKGKGYTVTDPNSLVKMARAKAGQMSARGLADELPEPGEAWVGVQRRLTDGVSSVPPMSERVVQAVGGWPYLQEMGMDRGRLIFEGEYRKQASQAAMGLLAGRMGS